MVSMVPVLLRDICVAVEYGYTASASHDIEGPQFLRITDIVPELIDWKTVPRCEIDSKKYEKFRLHHDDIVIARTGATVGYAKRLKNPPSSVFASYLVRLKIDPTQADPGFVGAIVESQDYKAFVLRNAGGAAQPNANAQVLTSYVLRLPDLSTQRRIASILSAYDDLIENNTRRIAILEEMARRIYEEWFVRFRFPEHEQVKMVESELGLIPEGWEAAPLADLVSTQYGYTESTQDNPVGPKFLRGMDINKQPYIDWACVPYCPISEEEFPKFKLRDGDILVIRMADPGKVGIVEKEIDAVFASYLVRLRIRDKRLLPYYLFYFLTSDRYQDYISGVSTGTTRKSASAPVITGISIALPPSELMMQFVQQIAALRRLMNNLIDKNANLRTTRDLLLPKLISGELDVSNLPEPETIAA